MSTESKTHYRKAFDSPYLSSQDVVGPTVLTIKHVTLELDRTKKTKDKFNTAWFVESELRPGEKLKPMILNATNSKTLKQITGSAFIDDWNNVSITVYVDPQVKFGKESVEGLRLMPAAPRKMELTPANQKKWGEAKEAFKKYGGIERILARVEISEENIERLISECEAEVAP